MTDLRSAGGGRLIAGLTWGVVLLGLWLWGREITDGQGIAGPATGDVAAVGRPAGAQLPPSYVPLADARPERLDIASVGVRAPVIERGLDKDGAVDPPPYSQPGKVGWYDGGVTPGAAGTALLVGHVDTDSRPAVFHRLARVKPGERVRVAREDGSVAEFTVEAVEVFTKDRFDPKRVYGPRDRGRAELRMITCGGRYDAKARAYSANVVVSAYLTGAVGAAGATARGVAHG
ncbi:class F sortase [Streptomyces pathocidini]|uniref:Class F sortase n=1 Tax=Streptomyces pathocidini TaxID=1650571 RepID=A0ABW7UU95_9ACTN|nr:class F sortase [Streptomyces pathocidini]